MIDMIKTLNLTQHLASAEQSAAGVVDLPAALRDRLVELLTFDELPTLDQIDERADGIVALVQEYNKPLRDVVDPECPLGGDCAVVYCMIGGAPFLMSALERALDDACLIARYAFSARQSVDETQVDGSIKKTSVFKHLGFVDLI